MDRETPVTSARPRRALATAAAVFFALALCAADGCEPHPKVSGPTVVVRNSAGQDWAVTVELARTTPEHMLGLMYRDSLEPNHGMLFIFDDVKQRRFWMKNTHIPLDMIFITETVTHGPDGKPSADRRILGIVENAEPLSETERFVPGVSRYVLEVYGGECAKHGVKAGDRVFFLNIGAW